jgi:hypothetical protein
MRSKNWRIAKILKVAGNLTKPLVFECAVAGVAFEPYHNGGANKRAVGGVIGRDYHRHRGGHAIGSTAARLPHWLGLRGLSEIAFQQKKRLSAASVLS